MLHWNAWDRRFFQRSISTFLFLVLGFSASQACSDNLRVLRQFSFESPSFSSRTSLIHCRDRFLKYRLPPRRLYLFHFIDHPVLAHVVGQLVL